jgi:acyl phosphate:glycerol-3-phosphate acyltransferase
MLAPVNSTAAIVVTALVGYLVGSLPVAGWWARRRGVADLRRVGDRNPGYWNARDQLGVRASTPVFVLDVTKGAAAAGVGLVFADHVDPAWALPFVGGGAAMVGHAWPVFARFRGGRSILAFVGTVLVAAPVAAAIAVVLTAVVRVATRRFDLAARVGVFAFPVVQIVVDGPWRTAATGVLMSLIGLRFAQAAWAARPERLGRGDPATVDPAA